MEPGRSGTALILLLLVLSTSVVTSSTAPGPQRFNPTGFTKFTVDPYTGAVVRASSDFTYYPLASALDATHHRLYLMELAGLIIVVDTSTGRALPEIDIGPAEATCMVFDPQNGLLYVGSTLYLGGATSSRLLGINTTTDRVVANVSTLREPAAMALDPDNGRLFVGSESGDGIDVFDTANNTLVREIQIARSSFANAVYDPANGNIYFLDGNLNDIVVLDGSTLSVVATIPTNYPPYEAIYNPFNKDVYAAVFNYAYPVSPHTRILGFDAANQVVANMTLAPYFENMFVDPNDGYLYFVGIGLRNYNISAIDPATSRIAETMNTTQALTLSSYDSAGHLAYFTTAGEYVAEFDTQSFSFGRNIPLFAVPEAMAYDAHDDAVYVASSLPGTNDTWVSLLSNQDLVGSVMIGSSTRTELPVLTASSKTGLAYISLGNDTIFVVNGTASKLAEPLFAQSNPTSMLYLAGENSLYVIEGGAGSSLEAINLTGKTSTSVPLNFLPVAMAYDSRHDRLILSDFGGGLDMVSPSTLKTLARYSLSLGGTTLTPTNVAYDSVDNLAYVGTTGQFNTPVLLALNATSGQEVYYSDANPNQGIVYDPFNDYIYAFSAGVNPVLASNDFPLGFSSVPFSGQFVSCGTLDLGNGSLYLGARVPGVVTIDATGPPFPGITLSQTQTQTETETVTATSTVIATTVQQSTTTVTVAGPAGTSALDLALAVGIVILVALLGVSAALLRRK